MRAFYASVLFPKPCPFFQQAALPAAPTPQPVTPAPIRIVLDDRTGQPAHDDGDILRDNIATKLGAIRAREHVADRRPGAVRDAGAADRVA